ncbi:hypothetical protein SEUCBS139899_009439 [Sporothrix eucalyptigena]|uniref:Heterokaryon incompatibility domain-containing protein n=1 Tax=Sporothrix eucalyptigena TaxID=1812306 RepID=A0ABP0CW42_9PEZI
MTITPRINGNARLCRICLAIFAVTIEPAPRDESVDSSLPVHKRHHPSVASLYSAAHDGCSICRVVDTTLAGRRREASDVPLVAQPLRGQGDGAVAATTYTITSIHDNPGHYRLAVFLHVNELRSVSFFSVARVVPGTVLNVSSPKRHPALIRQWMAMSKEPHSIVQQNTRNQKGPRRLLELRAPISGSSYAFHSGYFRVQTFPDGASVEYATVSHRKDILSEVDAGYLRAMDTSGLLYPGWHPFTLFPDWLQRAARTTMAAGLSYMWVPMDLITDGYEVDALGCMYAKAVFNIAFLDKDAPQESNNDDDDEGGNEFSEDLPVLPCGWMQRPHHHEYLTVYQSDMFSRILAESPLPSLPDFHLAVMLAPATLFLSGSHIWWQSSEGTLYGDLVATGAGPECPSALTLYGTHSTNAVDWRSRLLPLFSSVSVSQEKSLDHRREMSMRLAGCWIAIVTAYANKNAVPPTTMNRVAIAGCIARTINVLLSSNPPVTFAPKYSYGVFSSGLIEQLCWQRKDTMVPAPTRPCLSSVQGPVPSWSWLSVGAPIGYQFLLANGSPSLRVNFVGDDAPRARRVAMASLWEEAVMGEEEKNTKNIKDIFATGALIPAKLDHSVPISEGQLEGQLSVQGVELGMAWMIWDAAEDVAWAEVQKDEDDRDLSVWPLFAQEYSGPGSQIGACGLILRRQPSEDGKLPRYSRCGWFQYNLSRRFVHNERNPIIDLARGDDSRYRQFFVV